MIRMHDFEGLLWYVMVAKAAAFAGFSLKVWKLLVTHTRVHTRARTNTFETHFVQKLRVISYKKIKTSFSVSVMMSIHN